MTKEYYKIDRKAIGEKETLTVGNCVLAERPAIRKKSAWAPKLELMRMREIEKIIRSRHGPVLPQTDDVDVYICAAALSCSGQDMREWCRKWAPWVAADGPFMSEIMAEAGNRRRMPKADAIAKMLLVTLEERMRLKLKTIGACDVSTKERKAWAKERKRERDRNRQEQRRRALGMIPRKSQHTTLEAAKPWEAAGISRRTWFYWQKKRNCTAVSRIKQTPKSDTPVQSPDFEAPPVPIASSIPVNASGVAGCAGVRGIIPRRGSKGQRPMGVTTNPRRKQHE